MPTGAHYCLLSIKGCDRVVTCFYSRTCVACTVFLHRKSCWKQQRSSAIWRDCSWCVSIYLTNMHGLLFYFTNPSLLLTLSCLYSYFLYSVLPTILCVALLTVIDSFSVLLLTIVLPTHHVPSIAKQYISISAMHYLVCVYWCK